VDAAGNYSIYTDGVLDSLSTGNSSFEQAVEAGGVVTFGITTDAVASDGTVNFTGLLDEIQIYNRPLTAAQVHGLFISNSPNPAATPSVLPSGTPVSLAGAATLNLNGNNQTIGTITGAFGSSVTLGAGTLTINAPTAATFAGVISGSGAVIKSGVGTETLSGINTYGGGTVVSGGTLIAANTKAFASGALTIHAASTVQFQPGLSGRVLLSSLTLDGSSGNWAGLVDLTNDSLLVTPASSSTLPALLAQLQNQVVYGRSTATAGVIASDLLPGQPLVVVQSGTTSVLVAPAMTGDANGDGSVDLNDLNLVLSDLGTSTNLWTGGNFDGAPTIDLTDLNDVLNSLGTSLASGSAVGEVTSAPEPASLSVLALGAGILMGRRRRSHRNRLS
jgi:fibronectin-binding autotransporter adhesin